MASVSEQLLAALDDLDADELKRFKWRFKNHYCVSSAALDKADPPDTVDLMMKRFGPEEAVKIMVEILRKMNQNHVADQLESRHKQAQVEASVEDPALVGAESEPIGDRKIAPDWDNMRINLKVTQRSFKQRIQQREKDLQQLKEAVESYKRSAQTAVEDSERIFTELIRSIERSRSEVTRRIRDQEQAALSRAEVGLERLEQEINDLRMRDAELEQLSHTQDHIQFRQSFQSLSAPPESAEVPKIPFSSLFSFDGLRESVRQLGEKLEDFCREEIKKISDRVTFTNIVSKTRNDLLQYYHQITLDPNTMNRQLVLSEKNSVITHTNRDQPYPDHPDRFHNGLQVLCRESVCGRSYWEIEWSGQVYIAVSYKSISRKGQYNDCRFGSNDQSWSLDCFDYSYSFRHNDIETKLPVKSISSRTGVYVDPSAGTLSFYSVDRDTMILIHTVQTTFTQPLYPGFWVGSVSSVKLC